MVAIGLRIAEIAAAAVHRDACDADMQRLVETIRKRPSLCTRRRGKLRRRDWLQRRSDRHLVLPADRLWLLDELRMAVERSSSSYGYYVRRFSRTPLTLAGRCRDIFPLRWIDSEQEYSIPARFEKWERQVMLAFVNLVIAS